MKTIHVGVKQSGPSVKTVIYFGDSHEPCLTSELPDHYGYLVLVVGAQAYGPNDMLPIVADDPLPWLRETAGEYVRQHEQDAAGNGMTGDECESAIACFLAAEF